MLNTRISTVTLSTSYFGPILQYPWPKSLSHSRKYYLLTTPETFEFIDFTCGDNLSSVVMPCSLVTCNLHIYLWCILRFIILFCKLRFTDPSWLDGKTRNRHVLRKLYIVWSLGESTSLIVLCVSLFLNAKSLNSF